MSGYRIHVESETTNAFLNINQIDDHVIFEYNYDNDYRETFCVNFTAHKGYKISSRNDTTELVYVDKNKILIYPQNDSLYIYQFISDPLVVDGALDLYFTPQLGIVLKKSTTWPNFAELSEHFLVQKNTLIKQLTSILLFNEYFTVALKVEGPPPPPLPPPQLDIVHP